MLGTCEHLEVPGFDLTKAEALRAVFLQHSFNMMVFDST